MLKAESSYNYVSETFDLLILFRFSAFFSLPSLLSSPYTCLTDHRRKWRHCRTVYWFFYEWCFFHDVLELRSVNYLAWKPETCSKNSMVFIYVQRSEIVFLAAINFLFVCYSKEQRTMKGWNGVKKDYLRTKTVAFNECGNFTGNLFT